MKEVILSPEMVEELEDIYQQLQEQYEMVAESLDFSCSGCPDNCCDSYFLHHTYAEWAHLWIGIKRLEPLRQQALVARAESYIKECQQAHAAGERPLVMCPLNEDGLCALYQHRLLVCRTHGVPAKMTRPDGRSLSFPGCFRCQEIVDKLSGVDPVARVERTPLLTRLARLENELLDNKRHLFPRVKLTIAEMLVNGPPSLSTPHCERHNK